MSKEFKFKPGAWLPKGAGVDAQTVGAVLEEIEQTEGDIKPESVVEAAADPASPIHGCFEWDDSAAAVQHRLEQARRLVRSVVVVYRDEQDLQRTTRAFVVVHREEGRRGVYIGTARAMSEEDTRNEVIRRAWNELSAFRRKYAELAAFGALFSTMDEIERALPPKLMAAE